LPLVGSGNNLVLENGRVYIAEGLAGLRIVDVDGSRISEIGSFSPPLGVFDVDVVGDYAFLAGAGAGILVLDISGEPEQIGFFGTGSDDAVQLTVKDGIAYVATGRGGLRIFDVSNPTSLLELGSFAPPLGVRAVDVVGNLAYIAGAGAGVLVVDVSDLHAPKQIGFFGTGENDTIDIALRDNLLYAATGPGGLQVFDVSIPESLEKIASFEPSLGVFSVEVFEDLALLTSAEAGLLIVDIQEKKPRQNGFFGFSPKRAISAVADKEHAYVTTDDGSLHVLSLICDP
jgi:hypothetical protein